jgi:signal transduction histidine kinase/DNA-binding NarL/FixJ family response regulator
MPDTWKLLIIDDCAEDRRIYRRYLLTDPHQSYEILEADSAEDGLALSQTTRCDVILLDFCLPDMSGLEFLSKLKQQQVEVTIPAIMLTGHGDEQVAVQAMKRGVQDYLVKQHLKADVLRLAVRNAIKQSSLQAQLNKTQERQRLIATTALRIRQSLNLEEILHTATVEVQQLLRCDRVVVYQFAPYTDDKTIANSAQSWVSTVQSSNIPDISDGDEEIKDNLQIYKGKICQIYGAGLDSGDLNLSEDFNIITNLVVPINLSNNGKQEAKLWGLLIAHQGSGERQWQPDEVEMLNEVSVQLTIAIQQAELLAQTQAALDKEKQLNAFKSQIIATVSHEYRTPLASILAAAHTLKEYGTQLDESKQKRFLQIVEEKARHLAKLVDDMLLVNQFELDKTKFQSTQLNMLQFFSDLIEQHQEIVGNSHELIFQITGNNQDFWGDRGLLRQIFVNLMSNAIKYSPDGGKIEFHLQGKDSQILFYIRDRGIGVPTQDQNNLFQSFSRGSNVDTIPGTGLGLAIAKACVELHGGEISLESQVGEGTKVTVSLPKRPEN